MLRDAGTTSFNSELSGRDDNMATLRYPRNATLDRGIFSPGIVEKGPNKTSAHDDGPALVPGQSPSAPMLDVSFAYVK